MSLVKTSMLNGIAVAVKVLSALVLNKILAIYVGPAGYAIIGQFQNVVSVIVSVAGGVVATGVTKTTAEHFDNETKQYAVWQTAIRFSLVSSLTVGLGLLFMGDWLSELLLHRADMPGIFVWLALALPAMAANNLLLAIINGKKEILLYVMANIVGSLVSMLVIGFLAYYFGLYGALVAFIITPAIVLVATATLAARQRWFNVHFLWGKISRPIAFELSGFALMALTSAMVTPISYMLIRDHLTTTLGLPAAGYWQASWKISETYLMLVTSTLAAYYLPRLAEIRTAPELKGEILKVYRFVMPVVMVGALVIYLMRNFVIRTLFTADFLEMRDLFSWQLTGDVIKIGSWILSYIMLGRALVKFFILTEICFSTLFVLLSWGFVDHYGMVGVPMAYTINYLLYWAVMWIMVKNEMRHMEVVRAPI